MKRLSLIAAACLLALTSCSESQQIENTAEVPVQLKPIGRANPVSTDATTESEVVEPPPPPLSPKARAFVKSVENDPTGFFFSVCLWDQTGMSQGIRFALEAAHKYDKTSVLMDKKEAMAITLHFANNGMLDKTDVPPAGVPLTGWNVNLSTKKVGAYWHLGKERDAVLKSAKVMGVRSVLTGKSLKAWDDFTQSVRNGKSQPIAEPKPDHPSKSEMSYRHEPPRKEGETIKTDDEIRKAK